MTIPKLTCPVVLVHGLFGFDRLQLFGWTMANYFPGIPQLLETGGNRVLMPRLAPTNGVAERATELKAFIDRESPSEPVHIIAHSMGGLDSRYMISKLGMADRVLSLTTIGTPHRGTAFADWGILKLESMVRPLLDLFCIPSRAFYDLTTAKCREFNEKVSDVATVRYYSVAGKHVGDWWSPEWQFTHRIVHEAEGPNDGVVSLASATYGEHTEIWECDHLSLVNWLNPLSQIRGNSRDRAPAYGDLVRRLADEGF